jgi:small conductance mechanosensitive channel
MPKEILQTVVIPIALRILLAALAWMIGRWLARRSQGWLGQSVRKAGLTESFVTLATTLSYYAILVVGGLVALGILGVPAATLAAALGVTVVVLAIALQQSLANLTATVLIVLFKPFEVGDIIDVGGAAGVVHEIQMFSTILISADNKTHVVPNSRIQASGLTNNSSTGRLRVSLAFRISYGSDIDKAKELLTNLLAADDRVLPKPPARVFVQQLADSYVELAALPFVNFEDSSSLQADMVERVKKEFESAGIVIPMPQQDVHLYTHS